MLLSGALLHPLWFGFGRLFCQSCRYSNSAARLGQRLYRQWCWTRIKRCHFCDIAGSMVCLASRLDKPGLRGVRLFSPFAITPRSIFSHSPSHPGLIREFYPRKAKDSICTAVDDKQMCTGAPSNGKSQMENKNGFCKRNMISSTETVRWQR